MLINTSRPAGGAALPTAQETPGGSTSGTRVPHAGLSPRAPRRGGAGALPPRATLGLLMGHRLEGAMSKTHDVLNQVASGEVSLLNTYRPNHLGKAVGTAVNGLAALMKNFPGLL